MTDSPENAVPGLDENGEDPIDYALEISEIYDGVCLWVYKDGTVANRFTPDWGRRYDRVEQYIAEQGLKKRETT